ncbi:MAG: efflux RND transporter periplasmic adaptor subunit [Planctomycetes bacterium]|nr:efflux RND transporter periplasmic adaptor subunit [Planctomycetota bacterium]
MKKVVPLLLLLIVGAAGGALAHRQLLASERDNDTGALRLHGSVDVRDAQLAFFGQERIREVLVEEGDRVAAGQLLARLHRERLDAEVANVAARIRAQQAVVDRLEHGTRPEQIAQARAEVAAAGVQVANAKRVIERVTTTADSGASSAQDVDDAKARLDVAEAELEVRRQALALAIAGPRAEDRAQAAATLEALRAEDALLQRRVADSELHAPAAGVIRTRILEPGEMAAPERPVFTLALTDPKWVRAYVPEPDLGRVVEGARATVRSDSFGGKAYDGWVGSISPIAEFTPKTVETSELRTRLVYEVRVFVRDPDDELPLGMPVTVDLVEAKGEGGK